MKQILISIKPEWVVAILNGEKTIEVRKTAPKCELPIEVYIYCTKTIKPISDYEWGEFTFDDLSKLGKVVAKFTLREIVPIVAQRAVNDGFMGYGYCKKRDFKWYHQIEEQVCLGEESLTKYLNNGNIHVSFKNNQKPKNGYAWHISDLEIFDEPKELSDFCTYRKPSYVLERAPMSWCYVEENE